MKNDASVTLAVNIPSAEYEAHVGRAVEALKRIGYEAHPMTGEYILRQAEEIKAQLAEVRQADILLAHAAAKGKKA